MRKLIRKLKNYQKLQKRKVKRQKYRRVIFLDFDGVLNNETWLHSAEKALIYAPRDVLEPAAIARLNELCEQTGAVVVISSSWRSAGLPYCRQVLRRNGFTGTIVGATTLAGGAAYGSRQFTYVSKLDGVSHTYGGDLGRRGRQIQQWLDGNIVESFVIIDDQNDMGPLADRLVWTNANVGFTQKDKDDAVWVLEGGRFDDEVKAVS